MVWPSTVALVATMTSRIAAVAHAAQQPSDVEFVRADAVERRQRAAQHVIAAAEDLGRAPSPTDRRHPRRRRSGRCRAADRRRSSRDRPCRGCRRSCTARIARAASASAVLSGCISTSRFFRRCSGDAAGRARAQPRQPAQQLDQPLDLGSVHAWSASSLKPGGSGRPPVICFICSCIGRPRPWSRRRWRRRRSGPRPRPCRRARTARRRSRPAGLALAVEVTLTMPAPELPTISWRSSWACSSLHLLLHLPGPVPSGRRDP